MKLIQHLLAHNLFKIFAILWTLLIIYLCLDDSPNVPKFTFPYKDKVVHFIFYFVFVYVWTKSLTNKRINYILIALFLGVIMGIAIEFMQENFTLHRTFDWYDILANSMGAVASFMYVKKFYAIKD